MLSHLFLNCRSYHLPAGPQPNALKSNDPKGFSFLFGFSFDLHLHTFATAYLSSLVHTAAICDRCMTCIEGAWFRCCYCPRDLCDGCQEVDTHDDTHIFLVFKSPVRFFKINFSYSNDILITIIALG